MDPFRGRFLDMAEGQSLKESENYQECDGVGPMTRANSPDLKERLRAALDDVLGLRDV